MRSNRTLSCSYSVRWVVSICAACAGTSLLSPLELAAAAEARAASENPALTSVALRDRTESGPMRFQQVDPSTTGIDFRSEWNPPEGQSVRGIGSTAACSGVCIGDYDGDGLPDVFLTRPFGGNRLYRNLGDFQFQDVTEQAGLDVELDYAAWGAGPVFVDINDDGLLDLYVCSHRRSNRLYINQGDGTFVDKAREYGLDFSGASVTMAFSDYDLDGDLDAYLVTNWEVPEVRRGKTDTYMEFRDGRLRIGEDAHEFHDVLVKPNGDKKFIKGAQLDHFYRNEGGRFVDVTREVLGAYSASENFFGHAARWFDYDDDGYPDLYIANDFYGPDQLFHNNRDGTLTDVTQTALPHIPWFSMGLDAADVNNDGRIDFMASDMSFTTHFKSKVNMGDMADTAWFLDSSNPRQYMQNALYINTGTQHFIEAASLAGVSSTDWTWALKFGDLDNDGRVDLYVSNGMTRNWFDSDVRAQAKADRALDGQLGPDTLKDWETIWKDQPPLRERNLAFRNVGDLKFEKVAEAWGLDFEGVSFGSALGDLDGDGDLDIVTVNFEDQAHIYRNEGSGNHRVALRLQGTRSNRQGIGAVVTLKTPDGIQMRDLPSVRGFLSADDSTLHFGLGPHEHIQELTVRWPSGHIQSVKDLAADQLYVLTEPDEDVPARPDKPKVETLFAVRTDLPTVQHREQSFDDFAREPLLPNRMSKFGPGIACADVNLDGRDDFYVAGAKGTNGGLILSHGSGYVNDSRSDPAFRWNQEVEEMSPLFFDADGDGDPDLYIVSGGVECKPGDKVLRDLLYINDGTGQFRQAPATALPDLRISGGIATAADVDRDGDLDLFIGGRSVPGRYPATPDSVLLINDGGTFTDATDSIAPGLRQVGLVTSAVWSDANDDGWLDLLVTCEWGPVNFWRNESGRLVDATPAAGLDERLGWWNGIAAGDVDHDGDIDYLVSNFGLNTKYHPHEGEPIVLYYGDMDGNGQKDIIEAKYINEELFPLRGKSCSTAAIPMLADTHDTFREFATATLPALYGEGTLQESQRFEVNTLESGLLLNDGSAQFEFRPLPRIAQVAPGFGVALSDVDADGHLDVYVVHNFYNPQRETTRMDGGVSQLLLGDGTGNFEAVEPWRSGLVVPGDAKGLSVADLNNDGRPDFLVTVNGGEVAMFENQSGQGHRPLTVRLKGRKGNPTAIGARVTVIQKNGVQQSAEIHGGGGYLSQSASTLFFGLGSDAQAEQVKVRWPNGEQSTLQVAADSSSLTLTHPAATKKQASAN